MRVWIDLLTPKQILFFDPLIKTLKRAGADVLATSRHYREVEQLAELKGLELIFVGEWGGREPVSQFQASLSRMQQLLPYVRDFQPEAAVSVASADCARISFALRIKHVAVNDSPHSVVAARLSIPLSHHLFTPWIIPSRSWTIYGIRSEEITHYKALDPAAWLKREDKGETPRLGIDGSKKTILVRVEESYAPYMIGRDYSWTDKVLDRLNKNFGDCNIVVLCRYDDQLRRIKEKYADSFIVPEHVVDGVSVIRIADVFVGMGGTMTTEAALMGVPTVSAFQGSGLYTERYLQSKRLLAKARNPDHVSTFVKSHLKGKTNEGLKRRARKLLNWMEDPTERIAQYVQQLKS